MLQIFSNSTKRKIHHVKHGEIRFLLNPMNLGAGVLKKNIKKYEFHNKVLGNYSSQKHRHIVQFTNLQINFVA